MVSGQVIGVNKQHRVAILGTGNVNAALRIE